MSENLDLVRRWNDAYRRGDWAAVEANLDPDILVRTDARWPEQRFFGREAVMAWYRDARESMGPDVRIEEIIDLGDGVLIRACWFIRGQHSDAQGQMSYTEINTYREGRVILSEFFFDHERALKAVGLEG